MISERSKRRKRVTTDSKTAWNVSQVYSGFESGGKFLLRYGASFIMDLTCCMSGSSMSETLRGRSTKWTARKNCSIRSEGTLGFSTQLNIVKLSCHLIAANNVLYCCYVSFCRLLFCRTSNKVGLMSAMSYFIQLMCQTGPIYHPPRSKERRSMEKRSVEIMATYTGVLRFFTTSLTLHPPALSFPAKAPVGRPCSRRVLSTRSWSTGEGEGDVRIMTEYEKINCKFLPSSKWVLFATSLQAICFVITRPFLLNIFVRISWSWYHTHDLSRPELTSPFPFGHVFMSTVKDLLGRRSSLCLPIPDLHISGGGIEEFRRYGITSPDHISSIYRC